MDVENEWRSDEADLVSDAESDTLDCYGSLVSELKKHVIAMRLAVEAAALTLHSQTEHDKRTYLCRLDEWERGQQMALIRGLQSEYRALQQSLGLDERWWNTVTPDLNQILRRFPRVGHSECICQPRSSSDLSTTDSCLTRSRRCSVRNRIAAPLNSDSLRIRSYAPCSSSRISCHPNRRSQSSSVITQPSGEVISDSVESRESRVQSDEEAVYSALRFPNLVRKCGSSIRRVCKSGVSRSSRSATDSAVSWRRRAMMGSTREFHTSSESRSRRNRSSMKRRNQEETSNECRNRRKRNVEQREQNRKDEERTPLQRSTVIKTEIDLSGSQSRLCPSLPPVSPDCSLSSLDQSQPSSDLSTLVLRTNPRKKTYKRRNDPNETGISSSVRRKRLRRVSDRAEKRRPSSLMMLSQQFENEHCCAPISREMSLSCNTVVNDSLSLPIQDSTPDYHTFPINGTAV